MTEKVLEEKPFEEMSTKEKALAYLDFYKSEQRKRLTQYGALIKFEEGYADREPIETIYEVGGMDQNDHEVAVGQKINFMDEIDQSVEWLEGRIAEMEDNLGYAKDFEKQINNGDTDMANYYADLEARRRENNSSSRTPHAV